MWFILLLCSSDYAQIESEKIRSHAKTSKGHVLKVTVLL